MGSIRILDLSALSFAANRGDDRCRGRSSGQSGSRVRNGFISLFICGERGPRQFMAVLAEPPKFDGPSGFFVHLDFS